MIVENKTRNSLKLKQPYYYFIIIGKKHYVVAKGLIHTLTLALAETVKFYELTTRLK